MFQNQKRYTNFPLYLVLNAFLKCMRLIREVRKLSTSQNQTLFIIVKICCCCGDACEVHGLFYTLTQVFFCHALLAFTKVLSLSSYLCSVEWKKCFKCKIFCLQHVWQWRQSPELINKTKKSRCHSPRSYSFIDQLVKNIFVQDKPG